MDDVLRFSRPGANFFQNEGMYKTRTAEDVHRDDIPVALPAGRHPPKRERTMGNPLKNVDAVPFPGPAVDLQMRHALRAAPQIGHLVFEKPDT